MAGRTLTRAEAKFVRVEMRLLGMALRERRLELGLTQEGLAEKADLSRNMVTLVESGERHPSMASLFLLMRALNLRISFIEK